MRLLVAVFHCPTRLPVPQSKCPTVNRSEDLLSSIRGREIDRKYYIGPIHYHDSQPDLLVLVNFTMLGIAFNNSWIDGPMNSVQILLTLTNQTIDALSTTEATTLIPGVNVVGTVNTRIRRHFKHRVLSAFGLFDVRPSTSCARE